MSWFNRWWITGLILLLSKVSAQKKNNPCLVQPGVAVKVMPLSLVDSYGIPSIRIANETRIVPGLSHEIDFGYYFPSDAPRHFQVRGFYLSNQLKHYFFLGSGFFAVQILYKTQRFMLKDSVTVETGQVTNPYYRYLKTIPIHRSAIALNLVIGKQLFFDRFIWEIYGGIGTRVRNVSQEIEASPFTEYPDYRDFDTTRQLYDPVKNQISLNIVAGFKFGYWLVR